MMINTPADVPHIRLTDLLAHMVALELFCDTQTSSYLRDNYKYCGPSDLQCIQPPFNREGREKNKIHKL